MQARRIDTIDHVTVLLTRVSSTTQLLLLFFHTGLENWFKTF